MTMRKEPSLPPEMEARIVQAAAFLTAQPQVEFAYLFGGLAQGRIGPLSDVDIAVYLVPPYEGPQLKLDLLGGLTETLGTEEVDLVVLNEAPLSLRGRILSSRKVLVDKHPFRRHEYESLTWRMFFDFSYREKQILARRYLRGR